MSNSANDTLLIKEIPISQNTVLNLSSHFSDFGKVKLITTGYNGDPRAALVTFATPDAARQAYNNPTPLFNDRMVQVVWHNANPTSQYSTATKQGWPCDICGRILASRQNLGMHKARMHAGVTCSVCNSRFETVHEYEKHFNVHHSEMSFNSSSGGIQSQQQSQPQSQSQSQSTQNIFQSNESKPFAAETFNKIRSKYQSLKKKLKKRDKANYKLVKFHTKTRKELTATIKEQEDQLKEKTAALEKLQSEFNVSTIQLSDALKKMETIENNKNSLQQEIGKLTQNLVNEQLKLEMLKHTLSCVYKCFQN